MASTAKMNNKYFKELRNSKPVQDMCLKKAKKVTKTANKMYGAKSYECNVQAGKNRCHAIVYTGDRYACRSNAKHNTLVKALNGGS